MTLRTMGLVFVRGRMIYIYILFMWTVWNVFTIVPKFLKMLHIKKYITISFSLFMKYSHLSHNSHIRVYILSVLSGLFYYFLVFYFFLGLSSGFLIFQKHNKKKKNCIRVYSFVRSEVLCSVCLLLLLLSLPILFFVVLCVLYFFFYFFTFS